MRKILFLAFIISTNVFAAFEMNENMQESYSHIINLEFTKAKDLLEIESIENPNNGFIPLHQNYIHFLTIFIGEERNYFESNYQKKNEIINMLEANDKSSPYYLYAQAEVHLQWAFARLKLEQYSVAAYEFVKAYKLLKKNQDDFPRFTLNKKCLGLMHSFLGAIPENFQWILRLAGLEGGVELGLLELDEVLDDNKYKMYESEILFLLSFFQINFTNNNIICQKYLDRIGDRYKDNLLLNFAAARLSHNLGKNNYCINVLESRPHSETMFHFHYLDYLQAMAYMYKLDYDNAKQSFEYFIADFKGINYVKSAYHKLAWIAYLRGIENNYFDSVIRKGNSLIDEDKVALRDAERNYITNASLLVSRLLYDGGYYKDALLELLSFKVIDKNSMYFDEYWYRSAKIKLKLDYNYNEVIHDFEKSYQFGENTANYYAPMSALTIGLIYEKLEDNIKAESYFQKCLLISDFDYQRGIHQKAKASLNRVSD
ncbi:MAG: hypothetical protein CMD16_04380 [Flavobacteriales bacterium]|nr:hypothetical protein [Flavobacteriales bacterium]|tara:strand:- start:4713 stop:6170 length:1458 start_codon:yes stop_codon:yes gene_type:complete